MVKYIWPMPHHADSIPWVQVKLANGDTLKTKLLVSLFLRHTHTHTLICHYPLFSLLLWFFSLISLDWCRWTQLHGEKKLGNTHSEVEL